MSDRLPNDARASSDVDADTLAAIWIALERTAPATADVPKERSRWKRSGRDYAPFERDARA